MDVLAVLSNKRFSEDPERWSLEAKKVLLKNFYDYNMGIHLKTQDG